MNVVKVKVIETVKGSPRVLKGARVTISPVFDKEKGGMSLKTGISRSEWEQKFKEKYGDYDKFYDGFKIVLNSGERQFDLEDPYNEIVIALLKNHPWVAQTNDPLTPHHLFQVYDEIEEAKKENKEFEYEMKAMKYLHDMSQTDRADFLKLFGFKNTENTSAELVFKKLRDRVKSDPKLFVEIFEDKSKEYKILISDLLSKQILKIIGGVHYFGNATDGIPMGSSIEQTVEYLKDPKHNDIVVQLKKLLTEKKAK